MALVHIDNNMANMTDDVRVTLGALIDEEVSRNKTFYVAEITGEDRKYGLSREFVTDKRSPYSLELSDFEIGHVYEIKDDREGIRCWFEITGTAASDVLPFDIRTLDRGDSCDDGFILEHVPGYDDGDDGDGDAGVTGGTLFTDDKTEAVARRLRGLTDDQLEQIDAMIDAQALDARKEDGTTGERVGAMVDDVSADEPRKTDDETRVSLANVPAGVRKRAKTQRSAFDAAFQKHMGVEAGPKLKAIASDAAVLVARSDN